ncbi:MAG: hypothetical protein WBI40_08835 [Methylococcaceae bacterium]
MKKRKYRKANQVHVRAPYKFKQREVHSQFKQFLAWYEEHQSEFKFKLYRFSENSMTIEGINPIVKLCYGGDINISVYWKGIYDELYSALGCPRETEHGYVDIATIKEWRTVYFTEQALMECEFFEPIRDWLNAELQSRKWASFYKYRGITGAYFGAEKHKDENTVGHIPIWLNYKETENDD